jgi:hypothetical protein
MASVLSPAIDSYFQNVPFRQIRTPDAAKLAIADSTYELSRDIIAMNAVSGETVRVKSYTLNMLQKKKLQMPISAERLSLPRPAFPAEPVTARMPFRLLPKKPSGCATPEASPWLNASHSTQMPWQTLVGFLGRDRLFRTDNGQSKREKSCPTYLDYRATE